MIGTRQRAFTLLETLVVLIISALIVALMFQLLAQFNRARQRIAAVEGVRNNEAVLFGWLRDSIRDVVVIAPTPGQVALPDDPALALSGDANGFVATTMAPLFNPPGSLTGVHWSTEPAGNRVSLDYEESPQHQLHFNIDAQRVVFGYIDADGKVQSAWPPSQGLSAPLPSAIQMTVEGGPHPRVMVQSLAMPKPLTPSPYAVGADE